MELTSLNNIVRKDHPYRKFTRALNFDVASSPLKNLSNEGNVGGEGYGLKVLLFTFVDATHLIAKANLWKERDEAIKQKIDTLNNETLSLVAKDKDAEIGCKGKKKYWYGYKQHVSVDMQSGLINKSRHYSR